MGKKLTKFLNVMTFGHLSRKAKKETARLDSVKNDHLTLNTVGLPDVQVVANSLGGISNVINITSTISTITFQVHDMAKVDIDHLKKVAVKGAIKSENNVTLIIGDCAETLKNKLLELKN